MSGALALLTALEAAAAPLRALDLGGNELCGGTVAEDHSFGAVQGAAARLSEHNQLCRLDADGLCSAGPKMLPDSGVYRIEFEVVQASDGDGAYIGMIKPDANRSSYPGSDDKGIGWRAKGGVRHLHNTVDVGGPIAGWGTGDRVGLLLDTHACELRFVKNGRLLANPNPNPNPYPSPYPNPYVPLALALTQTRPAARAAVRALARRRHVLRRRPLLRLVRRALPVHAAAGRQLRHRLRRARPGVPVGRGAGQRPRAPLDLLQPG